MATARERQIAELCSRLPCPNCGHETSPLGSHDCYAEQTRRRRVAADLRGAQARILRGAARVLSDETPPVPSDPPPAKGKFRFQVEEAGKVVGDTGWQGNAVPVSSASSIYLKRSPSDPGVWDWPRSSIHLPESLGVWASRPADKILRAGDAVEITTRITGSQRADLLSDRNS